MSGGHWEYKDGDLKVQIFGWKDKPSNALDDIELSELLWDMLNLLHDYDWYISGDTGREDWDASRKAFKKKWLSDSRADNLKTLIEKKLAEVKDELEEML